MRVIVSGYYGFGNGGDEALLLSLLQMLPASVEPIVLSRTPQTTAQTYQVTTCPRSNGLALQTCFSSSDAFLWGGGSLLQDRTSWRSPLYYLGLMGWAQQLGLKTIAWAQGIGPLDRQWTQWLSRRCLGGCAAVSVRDAPTARLCQEWGISHVQAPDPVWALESNLDGPPLPGHRIAVALRPHRHLTPTRLEALTQALQAFQKATGVYVLLIPFQIPQGTPLVGGDYDLAQHLHQHLPGVSQILILRDPRQLKGIFRGVELTITMRYHGLVMAAAEGSRCFGISYDPKVSTLLQALDMPGWELDQMPIDPNLICRAWLDHLHKGEALRPQQIETWRQDAWTHAKILQDYLSVD